METSILGVPVKVIKVDIAQDDSIVAICARGRERQAIPLLDLPLPSPKPPGAEWIEAYRYWARGQRGAVTRSNKRGWSEIKAHLRTLDHRSLLALVGDLYRASEDNRRFLHARLLEPKTELSEHRRLISAAVFPDPFSRRPIRIGEAKRLIREYNLATGDAGRTVDLMLTMVEAGTEQAVDLGYGDDKYFASLETAIDGAVKLLADLPAESRREATERLVRIANRAADIGWGYGDYVCEIAARAKTLSGGTAQPGGGAGKRRGRG